MEAPRSDGRDAHMYDLEDPTIVLGGLELLPAVAAVAYPLISTRYSLVCNAEVGVRNSYRPALRHQQVPFPTVPSGQHVQASLSNSIIFISIAATFSTLLCIYGYDHHQLYGRSMACLLSAG